MKKDTPESASADLEQRSVRPNEDNLEVFRNYRKSCVVSDVLISRLSSVGLCGGADHLHIVYWGKQSITSATVYTAKCPTDRIHHHIYIVYWVHNQPS